MSQTIAIIGALEKEVRLIRTELGGATCRQVGGVEVVRGSYHGVSVAACVAGMGTVNAAAATQLLIGACGAGTVIFSGIAGALNPALRVGDVVIGERLRYTDTDTALIAESAPHREEFASTPALVDLAACELMAAGAQPLDTGPAAPHGACRRFLRGTIATGNRFVTGAEQRAAVVAATQADCAEMEGAAVAHIAAKNGADCLVLRAISDSCDEAYDALSARQLDLEEYARQASALVLGIVRRMAHSQTGPAPAPGADARA